MDPGRRQRTYAGAGTGGGNSSSILAIYEVGSCVGKLDINSHYTSPTHFLPTAPLQASLLATIHPLPVREHIFLYITVRKSIRQILVLEVNSQKSGASIHGEIRHKLTLHIPYLFPSYVSLVSILTCHPPSTTS